MELESARILVPVNGLPAAERTFRWACRYAKQHKAELHAVYVIEVSRDLPLGTDLGAAMAEGERILERIEDIGAEEKFKSVQAKMLQARQAGPALVQEAEERHMDLVILGAPYRRRFGNCHLGATSTYIFNNSACRVIFLREQAVAPFLEPDL